SDINAFLECLEEFGEARFILAQGGDVAAENGEPVDLVVACHRMSDAIVIANGVLLLETDLDDSGPVAALDETRQCAADQFGAVAAALFEELVNLASDNLLVVGADEIRKAAIHGADFALQRESDEDIVEGIDEVAIALLCAGDDGKELVKLLLGRRRRIPLLQAVHEPAQLRDFLRALPSVGNKKNDDDHQSGKKRFEPLSKTTDGAPRDDRESDRDQKQEEKG